jgi:hypothetical protein
MGESSVLLSRDKNVGSLSLDSAEMEASTSPSPIPDYSLPVSKLLTYGDCLELGIVDEWPNYLEMGFTQADIPELVRLASDRALFDQDESEEAVIASWAPLHAWRTLGQLQAEEAIEPLLEWFRHENDDWSFAELPIVYGLIGPVAIPALTAFLGSSEAIWPKMYALRCLEHIVKRYPDAQKACIQAIVPCLEQFQKNDPELNGLLTATLIELQAKDEVPLIQAAYESGCVVEGLYASWQEAGEALGVIEISEEERQQREERRQKRELLIQQLIKNDERDDFTARNAAINRSLQANKEKRKRKATKKARQQNRKGR